MGLHQNWVLSVPWTDGFSVDVSLIDGLFIKFGDCMTPDKFWGNWT